LSLDFYNRSLAIALKTADNQQAAGIYNSMGTIYYSQKSFTKALNYYNKGGVLFATLKDSANMVQCVQNCGSIHLALHQYDRAEGYLVKASAFAKKLDLNEMTASSDFFLAQAYIGQNKFKQAEKAIREGMKYASIIRNGKLSKDLEDLKTQAEQRRKG